MTIALLAPVPEEHLLSGADVCASQGEVAFGSRAWELFQRLDDLLAGQPCDCLIYASDSAKPVSPPTVTWKAQYIRQVASRNGAHPAKMTFRPPSTERYEADNKGHWAIFWHVANLKPLSVDQRIKVSSLRGYEKPNRYLLNFIPEGPVLIGL
jgi:hypothetical protein